MCLFVDVKLKDIKPVSCVDDQSKWAMDLKLDESVAQFKESEEKDHLAEEKVPLDNGDRVVLDMEEGRVLHSPSSVTDSAHSMSHLLSDTDSSLLPNGAISDYSSNGVPGGASTQTTSIDESDRITSSSMGNVDIHHLADAADISYGSYPV